MQSDFLERRSALLVRTPSHRQVAARRWLAALCAVAGLALVSGVVGSLIHPTNHLSSRPATGPFSYFPSQ
jgi:hypothetical protein